LLSGVDPLSCRQIPVLLQPLLRVDDFERIGAGSEDLAE